MYFLFPVCYSVIRVENLYGMLKILHVFSFSCTQTLPKSKNSQNKQRNISVELLEHGFGMNYACPKTKSRCIIKLPEF